MRRAALLAALLALAPAPARAAAADAPANVQGDPGHTGSVETDLAPPLGKRWVREDLGDTFGTPVIADGKVFVVAQTSDRSSAWPESTRLVALDAGSGATVWTQPAMQPGIAYGDGLVYAVTGETTFQAFDAATGAVRWTRRFEQDQGLEGYPTAAEGEVYIHGDGLYALNAADGTDRWPGSPSGGAVAVTEDRVFAANGGGAHAFERRLGVRLWTQSGSYGGDDELVLPVAADGRLYVSFGGQGTIFDQADGRLVGAFTGEAPAVADGRTFHVDPALRAADAETGATLWERSLEEGIRSLPLVVGDLVLVRAGEDALVGFDAASGDERFRSTTRITDESSVGRPLALGLAARGDRLVVPFTGKLIAYGSGPDTPGVDPDPFRAPGAVSLRFTTTGRSFARVFGRGNVLLEGEYERREGAAADDSPVELQEDPWPFDEDWTTVQESRSPSYERLSFRPVSPDRNARYRLRYAGVDPPALTDPLTVWVELALRVRYRYLSRTRLQAIVTLRGPADALARRTRLHFYFLRKRTGRATRIKSITLRRRGERLTRRTVMRVPLDFGRRDFVFPCYRERVPDAWGEPIEALRLCGRKRV